MTADVEEASTPREMLLHVLEMVFHDADEMVFPSEVMRYLWRRITEFGPESPSMLKGEPGGEWPDAIPPRPVVDSSEEGDEVDKRRLSAVLPQIRDTVLPKSDSSSAVDLKQDPEWMESYCQPEASDAVLVPSKLLLGFADRGAATQTLLSLAVVSYRKGFLERSATCLIAAVTLGGVGAKILLHAARLFKSAGLPMAGLWAALSVLRFNKNDRDAILLAAQLAESAKIDAILIVTALRKFAPNLGPLKIALVKCFAKSGNLDGVNALLGTIPKNDRASAEFRLLEAQFEAGKMDRLARGDLLQRAALSEDATGEICLSAGCQLAELGDFERARMCLVKALVMDPGEATKKAFIERAIQFPYRTKRVRSLPLALITQVQRSGGTLLTQLLDGHPEVLCHPHEIHIGSPNKWNWPTLDPAQSVEASLSELFEKTLPSLVLGGYRKPDRNSLADRERFRFDLDIAGLCAGFHARLQGRPAESQRQIIDAYFDAFFDAWTDYPETGREKWFAGFIPRLLMNRGSIHRLRNDYPDGKLIVCIRDPRTWFVSSRRHDKEYESVEHAIELWRSSTLSATILAREDPEVVHLTTYEMLVGNTEEEMRVLASRLGIAFHPCMLTPTFMGQQILPNSSFEVAAYGVHRQSLETHCELSYAERSYIEREALDLYHDAVLMVQNMR